MERLKILITSNGYGEDIIACQIIKELRKEIPSISFSALPIVGDGRTYLLNDVQVLGPARRMPSDGFLRSLRYLLMDIRSGLIDLFIGHIKVLKNEGRKADFIIVVGDTFLNTFSGFWTKKKTIFVSTAQSVNIREYLWIDKWLMRRYSMIVFPRDRETASYLKASGIPAVYLGNVMMDCIQIMGIDFGIPEVKKVIGLLPGSRNESYENFQYILEVVEEVFSIAKEKGEDLPVFLLALAPSSELERMKKIAKEMAWSFKDQKRMGILGEFRKVIGSEETKVIISDKFGDVVSRSEVIIGLSGTGNEQAVGLGKPVVAFPGRGPQMTLPFLLDQQRLLKGAVIVVPRDRRVIAQEVFSILNDPSRKRIAQEIGVKRMESPGASKRISSYLKKTFFQRFK